MPAVKNSHRVVKRKPSQLPARSAKRRNAKRRAPAQNDPAPNALLISAFAEALGQISPAKPKRSSRRSLSQAIAQASSTGDVIGVMPGVRIQEREPRGNIESPSSEPQAFALKRKRASDGMIRGAASWCVTLIVTAGIVSAAAYGVASQAPAKTIQAIAAASASQF